MKTIAAQFLGLAVLFVGTPAQAPELHGVVTDIATGRPLDRVTVVVESAGVTSDTAATDGLGEFHVKASSAGRSRLRPSKPGYIYWVPGHSLPPAEPGPVIEVSPNESPARVDLFMAKEGAIYGRVLSTDGSPMVAYALHLLRKKYLPSGTLRLTGVDGVRFITADDRGNYRFGGLTPGEYFIAGGAPVGPNPITYYPGVMDVSQAEPIRVGFGQEVATRPLIITKQDTTEFRLRLTGKLLSAGVVQLYMVPEMMLFGRMEAPDLFVPPPVAVGSHTFLVTSQSNDRLTYGHLTINAVGPVTEASVAMESGIRVTARATSAADPSTHISRVHCALTSDSVFPKLQFRSGGCLDLLTAPGTYNITIDGLVADEYVSEILVAGKSRATSAIPLTTDTNLTLVIGPTGGRIAGRLSDSKGNLLQGATVVLVPSPPFQNDSLRYRTSVTTNKGQYELRGVAPGEYELFGWSEIEPNAYRNQAFMERFKGRGVRISISASAQAMRVSANLTALAGVDPTEGSQK